MDRTIVILAAGSRGDIQPCVALGQELLQRGHRVRIVASRRYLSLIESAGLEFAALTVDPLELLDTEEGEELLAGGRNPARFLIGFRRIMGPVAGRMLRELLVATKDADLFLCPTLGFLGDHLGEHLGIPWALIHFQPSEPTREFAHPLVGSHRLLRGRLNRLSFDAIDQVAWQLSRPFINPWRRELGLAPLSPRGPMRRLRGRTPVLCCFSEAVVPRPADWQANVHVTGYWFLDEPDDWTPPTELTRFLADGPPPVYVGFGSMLPSDPATTDQIVRAALRLAGVRGLLARMPGAPEPAPDGNVHVVDDVPHSWLFPRTAAVVHHGGAGTVAAGLRAGVPTVVCPFFGDQHYWGDRVAAIGAGPAPVPFRDLTVARLAAAIRAAVGTSGTVSGASLVGRRIRAEDGAARAADVLCELLAPAAATPRLRARG